MKKQNIIIIMLSIIIFILSIAFIAVFINRNITSDNQKSYSIDGSKMNNEEEFKMLQKENYTISMTQFTSSSYKYYYSRPIYITLENKQESIRIERIVNTLTGTLMTYRDKSINYEYADLIYSSYNNSDEKKQQYKAFTSWLQKYNISKTQLSDLLDWYYKNNSDKIEIIDEDKILSK